MACQEVGIDRQTYYNLLSRNPNFKKSVDDIQNIAIDFVENSLMRNIKAGDTTATLFYLKTKGKCRGYQEKQEIDVSNKDGSLAPKEIIVNVVRTEHNRDAEIKPVKPEDSI